MGFMILAALRDDNGSYCMSCCRLTRSISRFLNNMIGVVGIEMAFMFMMLLAYFNFDKAEVGPDFIFSSV